MSDFWNAKFKGTEYLYGTAPNPYFKDFLDLLEPGKLLLPAEGEGRNATYASIKGWEVTAFDNSMVAKEKALALAARHTTNIQYFLHGIEDADIKYQDNYFDVIALCYLHLPPADRTIYHRKMMDKLKPEGYLYIIGFSKEQLNNTSGGPPNAMLLFDTAEMERDFKDVANKEIQIFEAELQEGQGHQGHASLIEARIRK